MNTKIRTYAVKFPDKHYWDEVDGRGATDAEAKADAERQARDLYVTGYDLVEIDADGEFGLVRW